MPTSKAPASPGPCVTAIASIDPYVLPASASACRTTGTIARRCSRDASSGTTPPYGWCVAICDDTTFESTRSPLPTTAAAVSSHELSIPRMYLSDIYLILLDLAVHRRERKGRKEITIRHGSSAALFTLCCGIAVYAKIVFKQRSRIAEIAENASG